MAPTAFTEDDDKKMGMPPALRMRLRKMYSGEDFRDSALLVKHINQSDKSYFRDKAEAMKNYKEGDAVEAVRASHHHPHHACPTGTQSDRWVLR